MIALAHQRPFTVETEVYPAVVVRLLVLTFFASYQYCVGLAAITGNKAFLFLLIVPMSGYVLIRIVTSLRDGAPVPHFAAISWIFVYTAVYSALFFPRDTAGLSLISNGPTLCVSVLFWHFAYSSSAYRGNPRRYFGDLWSSLLIGLLAGFVMAEYAVGFRIKPGLLHDLSDRSPFVRSDLDVPIFALMIGVVGIVHLWQRERLRPSLRAVTWLKARGAQYGASLLLLSVFTLFMYGRRTPLIAMALVVCVLVLPLKWGIRSLYGVFFFPIIPLFWNVAVKLLIPLTQNPLVSSLLTRNDPTEYLTATNRLHIWIRTIAFLLNFRLQHLWGYGKTPAELVQGTAEWTHVHNAFMQMALDAGFITLILAVVFLIQLYRRLAVLVQVGAYRAEALGAFAAFVSWLVISGVEPLMRTVSGAHLTILALAVAVANLYRDTTPSPLGSTIVVLPIPQRPGAALHAT